jgi:hypothetical protein
LDTHEPITAADLLNDRVLPVFDSHRVKQIDRSSTIFSVLCGLTATHKPEFSRCD